ncbi:hypothetical protein [Fundidesulfovibrio agrisoli]|uniref:hypothetical protein n=1 Tax=Fundidesulfovibrio agrisoli TaxID=2922717 RepID=UPI001FAC8007|nr:hypothetical protein [Fundidesulfovibrio agrisoli]
MRDSNFPDSLDPFLGTLARLFAAEGAAREVAILANARAKVEQTDYDNWDGGTYGYSIYLEIPTALYAQINDVKSEIEQQILAKAGPLMDLYPADWIQHLYILPEIKAADGWQEKAKAWLTGSNITNQGRVRSDNIASRSCDGLLFRSQPEINFYRAAKALGVSFAPLPVFIRGGRTYKRIEPDFVIIKDGIVMVVEIDGDTVHHETPAEAHDRTTILLHEGVHFERLKASECETPELAAESAERIIRIIARHKASR